MYRGRGSAHTSMLDTKTFQHEGNSFPKMELRQLRYFVAWVFKSTHFQAYIIINICIEVEVAHTSMSVNKHFSAKVNHHQKWS